MFKDNRWYNYLALEDDVWVYTGITSVSGDRSNVGFVLMNSVQWKPDIIPVPEQRNISAMESAEGQVQKLKIYRSFSIVIKYFKRADLFYGTQGRSRSGEKICDG